MENEEDVLNMHAKGFSVNIGGKKVTASFPPPFLESFKKKLLVAYTEKYIFNRYLV